jgi:hypothetical protein
LILHYRHAWGFKCTGSELSEIIGIKRISDILYKISLRLKGGEDGEGPAFIIR